MFQACADEKRIKTALDEDHPIDFMLPRLGGSDVRLVTFRGQPVLLHLFATWDLQCQAEAPHVDYLYRSFHDRGLEAIGIAVDVQSSLPVIRTHVEYVNFTFDVAIAAPTHPELVQSIGVTRQIPRTLLLESNRPRGL